MRRSTFGIPRLVACAELLSHRIALPRGCIEAMRKLLDELGIDLELRDERNPGRRVDTTFLGELTFEQRRAADALLAHETGVPAAATGFGKTVVAASMVAARGANTLVLVHRRQLMDQWIARLGAFLDLPASQHRFPGRPVPPAHGPFASAPVVRRLSRPAVSRRRKGSLAVTGTEAGVRGGDRPDIPSAA